MILLNGRRVPFDEDNKKIMTIKKRITDTETMVEDETTIMRAL